MTHRLAAVVPYFNPAGYRRLVQKYERFRDAFFGCDLFVIEASFSGRFETDARFRIRANERQVLWQKERMVRLASSWLPDRYDRVAWIDADVLFLNPGWARETGELLEERVFVQLFESCQFTDRRGRVRLARPSAMKVLANHKKLDGQSFYAPGLAWAAHRDVLERNGIAEFDVVGGGDAETLHALLGRWDTWQARQMSRAWRWHWLEWGRGLNHEVRGRVGVVPGDVVHLWHGTRADRRYSERIRYLADFGYDPKVDVRVADNGLLEWASEKLKMRAAVREYFGLRREGRMPGELQLGAPIITSGKGDARVGHERGHTNPLEDHTR